MTLSFDSLKYVRSSLIDPTKSIFICGPVILPKDMSEVDRSCPPTVILSGEQGAQWSVPVTPYGQTSLVAVVS